MTDPSNIEPSSSTSISSALKTLDQTPLLDHSLIVAYYRKMSRRRGGVAIFATSRKLATLVFRMLKYGQDYTDIGEQAYEAHFQERHLSGLKSSAKSIGYELIQTKEAV